MRIDNQKLAQIIERCFDLAGDTSFPPERRKEYLIIGKQLRGHLVNLISATFTEGTKEVLAANANLDRVNRELDEVGANLTSAVKSLENLGALLTTLDGLLKLATSFV